MCASRSQGEDVCILIARMNLVCVPFLACLQGRSVREQAERCSQSAKKKTDSICVSLVPLAWRQNEWGGMLQGYASQIIVIFHRSLSVLFQLAVCAATSAVGGGML